MAQEGTFNKKVITKSDGRYLIFYDFASKSVDKEAKQEKDEERK
ncbi:hypothetical protein [Capillibacterium thermochitinicola]|nr:hypothetical protein [Capillibacterium thermochitinicola]